jgi:putative hydroxymethylpyrimidine transport system ATP-binding protein
MDEPFSQLDAITRHRMQDDAARLLAGKTVLHVTHDPWEAVRLAHRILVLAGRPASLRPALPLAGPPPRDAALPALTALHATLLAELGAAQPRPSPAPAVLDPRRGAAA